MEVAHNTTNRNEWFCLYSIVIGLPIIKVNAMDIQQIIVYILVTASVAFLIKKYFFKKKKAGNCGSDDCGCH
ncbi:FeoB-associated Cys-rich membrane protein [Flavobacterium sp. Sd200]|uniref:FeoB-associated Cys-rich membrane protein n=1 Tax=Flavobacterium sp. Sd200 TaxID=2692211 RepID=UPI00351BB3B6